MWISDALGRFHGDVNSDSLLVQPARCGIAKKHRQERTTGSASGSAVSLSCSPATQHARPGRSPGALVEPVCTRVDLLPLGYVQGQAKGTEEQKRSL